MITTILKIIVPQILLTILLWQLLDTKLNIIKALSAVAIFFFCLQVIYQMSDDQYYKRLKIQNEAKKEYLQELKETK